MLGGPATKSDESKKSPYSSPRRLQLEILEKTTNCLSDSGSETYEDEHASDSNLLSSQLEGAHLIKKTDSYSTITLSSTTASTSIISTNSYSNSITDIQGLFQRLDINSSHKRRPSMQSIQTSSSATTTTLLLPNDLADTLDCLLQEPDSTDNLVLDDHGSIKYATPVKLVDHITSTLDNGLIEDFLLTFRCFMPSFLLAHMLGIRLRRCVIGAAGNMSPQRQQLMVRCFVMMRHWAMAYWDLDFSKRDTTQPAPATILLEYIQDAWVNAPCLIPTDRHLLLKLQGILEKGPFSNISDDTKSSEVTGSINLPSGLVDFQDKKTVSKNTKRQSKNSSGMFKRLRHKLFKLLDSNSSDSEDSGSNSSSSISAIVAHLYKTSNALAYTASIFVLIDCDTLAEHFCLIEQEYFKSVGWCELLAYTQKQGKERKQCSSYTFSHGHSTLLSHFHNLQSIITRFNQTSRWLSDQVLMARSLEDQAGIIRAFISIAFKCLAHANYNTLMQLILTLQSPAIESLTPAWKILTPYDKEMCSDLAAFAAPWKNFTHIRRAMETLEAANIKQPCVPFIGLYLNDLCVNDERMPRVVSKDKTGHEVLLPFSNSLLTKIVPFYKYRTAARIIRQFRTLQGDVGSNAVAGNSGGNSSINGESTIVEDSGRTYKFTKHPDLYHYLINIVSTT